MRFNDGLIGIVLILFGAAVLLYTRGFPTLEEGYPGPALFPNVLAVLFLIAGLVLLIQGARSKAALIKIDRKALGGRALLNILSVLPAVVVYIFLSEPLGLLILSFGLLFLLMTWFRATALWSMVMACSVTLGIYLLFSKFLLVPLPWGLWGW
jgi:putative tricarboxylic transport membrane protein